MNRGYIKVWRKIADNDILKNHKYCAFFLWSLTKASHKEKTIIIGGQSVHILPGQFILGRKSASLALGMSEQEIRTCLKLAQNLEFLTIKSTNKFSIISVINWDIYQGSDYDDQPADQPTSNQQATNKQPQIKNVKNYKNNTYAQNEFETFYQAYPKHKAKGAALKAWKNIKGEMPPIDSILKAIEDQKRSEDWQKDNGQFIPYPATWINQRRWEDEVTPITTKKAAIW